MAFDVTLEGGLIKITGHTYPIYIHPSKISMGLAANDVVKMLQKNKGLVVDLFSNYSTPSESSAVLLADAIAGIIPGASSAIPWDPSDEWNSTNLKLWLDSSEIDWKTGDAQEYLTFNTTPEPDTVSQWDDRSGNNNDVSNASATQQPILGDLGGGRYVNFQDVTDNLRSLLLDEILVPPFNICFLTKQKNITSSKTMFDGTDNTNLTNVYISSNKWTMKNSLTNKTPISEFASFIFEFNGASSKFHYSGTDESGSVSPSLDSLDSIEISNNRNENNGSELDLMSVIIINESMTEAQREKMEGYFAWILNDQYGENTIVNALPGGHPYKSSFPTV